MPRNITVTDAQGNLCQPTWPKRAKGLVKHGRAVYVSENHIRLTPSRETEENAMTANDILQKIFELSQDKKHIDDALATLQFMPDKTENGDCGAPPDVAGQAKADAIGQIACSAETTRQQLLTFYIRVYDSLTGNAQAAVFPEEKKPRENADPTDYAALSMKIAEEYV